VYTKAPPPTGPYSEPGDFTFLKRNLHEVSKRYGVNWEFKTSHREKLCDSYRSPSIARIIKFSRL